MAKQIKKGTGLNNVSETWDENERKRISGDSGSEDLTRYNTSEENDLEQVIHKEAAEYDNENKENRILGGERASVNDED
ncbi:MAG: hypothetical protein M3413_05910 [Bacteroidota bacterium]|jgi:hypothetical protein|nr:hypothetical protein [Flavisolibacter sp.]MDQ3551041.1 hypothetical protein [Bacteroidota bacterium]